MAAIHETAYPRIKPNLTRKELKEIFTPRNEELILLNSKTKKLLSIPRRPISVNKLDNSKLSKIYLVKQHIMVSVWL